MLHTRSSLWDPWAHLYLLAVTKQSMSGTMLKDSICHSAQSSRLRSCVSLSSFRKKHISWLKSITSEWPSSSSSRIAGGRAVPDARSCTRGKNCPSRCHPSSRWKILVHGAGRARDTPVFWTCAPVLPWRFEIGNILWNTWVGRRNARNRFWASSERAYYKILWMRRARPAFPIHALLTPLCSLRSLWSLRKVAS